MKKLILAIFYLFVFNSTAVALVEVDITRGNLDPLPIAVSPFFSEKDVKNELNNQLNIEDLGLEISKVVANNGENSVNLMVDLFNNPNKLQHQINNFRSKKNIAKS